ncbi:helix-turn-helix transcriptional regulator [Prosthecobacter sp.]|uniref:helix-turn-helix transcriptional regulator n=1 Tax=Prosthecobacter sp. TaxID=1965333 RepID=UPI0025FD69E8|nr:helix-turn-helix transcriptional regulator [Prosthecobacter sp.]
MHSLELWRKEDGGYQAAIDIDYGTKEKEIMQQVGVLVPVQHPCYQYIAGGGSDPVRLADFVSQRQFKSTDLYQVAFRPLDVIHQMSIPLITETHLGGLTLNRQGRRPFAEEDVRLAAQFARFVVQAHHTEEVLARALEQRSVVEAQDHLPLRRAGLSRREAEVLHWMAQGKRDKEIAIILGISHRTVTHHVSAILAKLGVENRTAAVATLTHQ